MTGDLPVGSYSSARLSSIGIGHTAIDIGGAYTSQGDERTRSSGTLGVTYNGENTRTNYQNGADSHLDWDVSQSLSRNWRAAPFGIGVLAACWFFDRLAGLVT